MSFYRNQYENPADNTYQSIPSNPTQNYDRNTSKYTKQRPASYHDLGSLQSSTVFITKDYRPTSTNPRYSGLVKLNDFRTKVSQVIDLCKRENTEVKGEFGQVVGEERQVYNMLLDNPSLLQRTMSYQNIPQTAQNMGQTLPYGSRINRPEDTTTPYQALKQQNNTQTNAFIPQFSQVGAKQQHPYQDQNIPYSKPVRPQGQQEYADYLNQPFVTFGSNEPSVQNMKNSLNKMKSLKHLNLSEDAMRLIEEIERRAFEEIEKLRQQKLQLMQRLNQQIKNVNDERKKNAHLSSLLNTQANQPQRPDGTYASNENSQFLQAQIQRLESELQRVNELNHNLRLELSQRGSGVPGIEQLLRQGEQIRLQTLRLLKLKEQGDSNQRVQELERRLADEQSQKNAVLSELKALKERHGQGSRNRPFQQISTYQRSVKLSSPPPLGTKAVSQYEDMVSQMKRITGY